MKYYNQTAPIYGEDHRQIEMDTHTLKPGYYKVYFRIETKGYKFNGGFENAADKEAFYDEVKFFENVYGIETNSGYDPKGPEYLYYNPQNISGVLHSSKILAWDYLMENGFNTFKCRCIDIYENVADVPDKLYIAYLDLHRQQIEEYILNSLQTKRSNLYKVTNGTNGDPYRTAEKKFGLKRCAYLIPKNTQTDPVFSGFYCGLFEELLSSGKLASSETKYGTGYRAVKTARKCAQ